MSDSHQRVKHKLHEAESYWQNADSYLMLFTLHYYVVLFTHHSWHLMLVIVTGFQLNVLGASMNATTAHCKVKIRRKLWLNMGKHNSHSGAVPLTHHHR